MFYLTTHSTHFIYSYMASDIWLRTILIVRKETRCRHIGYSFRLTARVLLYATDRIAHTTAFVTPVVEHWLERETAQWVHPTKNRPDDPSHHERTLLPRSYILLPLYSDDFPAGGRCTHPRHVFPHVDLVDVRAERLGFPGVHVLAGTRRQTQLVRVVHGRGGVESRGLGRPRLLLDTGARRLGPPHHLPLLLLLAALARDAALRHATRVRGPRRRRRCRETVAPLDVPTQRHVVAAVPADGGRRRRAVVTRDLRHAGSRRAPHRVDRHGRAVAELTAAVALRDDATAGRRRRRVATRRQGRRVVTQRLHVGGELLDGEHLADVARVDVRVVTPARPARLFLRLFLPDQLKRHLARRPGNGCSRVADRAQLKVVHGACHYAR